jgi:thymidylate synthase
VSTLNYTNAAEALVDLAGKIMRDGDELGSRAGRVKEITHEHFALLKPWQREILVPGRKVNLAAQIAETMWVLSGRDDIGWLSHYLPRAADFSDDGETWRAGYGPRLRKWSKGRVIGYGPMFVDQFAECYRLLAADPATRRAVMSIWDPAVDYQESSKDIPCNNWLSWSSRLGYLDLSVAIRSNDLIWGWSGINAFEWSAMLEVMAGLLGLRVGKLVFTQTSLHIYDQHWEKANRIAKASAVGVNDVRLDDDSPRFSFAEVGGPDPLRNLDALARLWFHLEYDIRTGSPMVQGYVDTFPEPMMRSWLRVLQWWWSGDPSYLHPLSGTRLYMATGDQFSVQPKLPESALTGVTRQHLAGLLSANEARRSTGRTPLPSKFIEAVCALHNEKHAAYGDSWKRRGEMLGIMANIARKIDRLGKGATTDETNTDTAIDLLVYLVKYAVWLVEQGGTSFSSYWGNSDETGGSNAVMRLIDSKAPLKASEYDSTQLERMLRDNFDCLEVAVMNPGSGDRAEDVNRMLDFAYTLARRLWEADQDDYRGADADG